MNSESSGGSDRKNALPPGTRVQEFEIQAAVGGGGFGIVYLAHDTALQRRVALKEYMPPLAARTGGSAEVFVPSVRDTETFGAGLRSFVNEARLLARFEHPALVKVHRFWEENGTAYMVMPFYDGPTLQRAVAEQRVSTDEPSLRRLLSPLLEAVAALHREKCFHRDISPDNILLTPGGLVLLDFGAARIAIGEASQNFTVILKEGYAPVEQYATEEATAMRQGPWTDIYALGGVIRYVITGRKPPSSVVRMASLKDPMEPLAEALAGQYSQPFLRAVDGAMSIHVEKRPQTIEEFRTLLSFPQSALSNPTLVRPIPRRSITPPPSPTPAAPDPSRSAKIQDPSPDDSVIVAARTRLEGDPVHRPALLPWAMALLVVLAVVFGSLYVLRERAPPIPRVVGGGLRKVPHTAPPEPSPSSRELADQLSADARGPSLPDARQQPSAATDPPRAARDPGTRPPPPPAPPRPRPLDPALVGMLTAADAGNWRAVERQAMEITRRVRSPPAGDRGRCRAENNLGLSAMRLHNFVKAADLFQSGVRADPSDIEVANNYGYALALAGRRAEAQEILTGVLLRDPTREVAWTALVEARGQDDKEGLAGLRIALHYAGRRSRTLSTFRDMAQTYPDERVQRVMQRLLREADQVPTLPEGDH